MEHPAAKIMVLASQMQEQEVGDGTNFVILFAAALLEGADDLLKMVRICVHNLFYKSCKLCNFLFFFLFVGTNALRNL